MLNKQQIIDRIREVNRSAAAEWLARFTDAQLRTYLEHLQLTLEPRGRSSRWLRPGDSPPVVAYAPGE
jgi:hypothetical protein